MQTNEILDKEFWKNPPLHPNESDVEIYKSYITAGTVLLLGCTKNLLTLSTNQMDTNPWYEADTVIIQNWADNNKYYDNIIGDGVFCFTKDLTDSVLEMCSKHCKTLVIRSFNKKIPIMRIADYFPSTNDFLIKPTHVIPTDEQHTFYVWKF